MRNSNHRAQTRLRQRARLAPSHLPLRLAAWALGTLPGLICTTALAAPLEQLLQLPASHTQPHSQAQTTQPRAQAIQSPAAVSLRQSQAINLPHPASNTHQAPRWTINSPSGQQWFYQPEENTRLWQSMPDSERQLLRQQGVILYSGPLLDEHGEVRAESWLRLAWVDGRWSGGWFDGEELYLVEHPQQLQRDGMIADLQPGDGDAYRLFRFSDLELPQLFDGQALLPGERQAGAFIQHLRELQRGATTIDQLPLTIVSDTQFTSRNGPNTQANVAARINFADGIYSGQLNVSLSILHHEVLTNNGTLTATDPFALLPDFATYMRTGAGSSLPRGGIAHLFSGRDFDGGVVGLAYIGVLCSFNFGYGIDQDFNGNTTSALIFAHELGHNFGAPHDGQEACANEPFRGIMNPSINGSTTFSPCSIQQMSDDIANASCLIEIPLLVLEDGFEGS